MKRRDGRQYNQLRTTTVTYGIQEYADGSVLFQIGGTKVLCSVVAETGVPNFLRGKGRGWLTAEYSLLPASTINRSLRDSSLPKGYNGRAVEISRLIGRVFRSIVNLEPLGERTIYIDCDVINADGGTRSAAITGTMLALVVAEKKWRASGKIKAPILGDILAAISVGLRDNEVLLDIDYREDNGIDADYNFVMTRSGNIIEVQGTSEAAPIAWSNIEKMREVATPAIQQLCELVDEVPAVEVKKQTSSGFTLADRLGKQVEK